MAMTQQSWPFTDAELMREEIDRLHNVVRALLATNPDRMSMDWQMSDERRDALNAAVALCG